MIEYVEGEVIKRKACGVVSDKQLPIHDRAVALLAIIDMYYMRMIEAFNDCDPKFRRKAISLITGNDRIKKVTRDQYISNWIYANVQNPPFIPLHDVIEFLLVELEYEAEAHPMMRSGETSYRIL
ncbi:hypothetical protein SAMN06296273_1179 [Nitrosomonas ureae]|uniref:Uncharacterized protein n=1 Tax=Nitrosomonas ureae TaxID=44577 RepID=A0A285BWS5_9PROT|nr:hypothetical protein [Nitrosomonas ureae]SNX59744.1 hypothetical protein SAMN06296273_1179 [Nitrosomonas ureae]